MSASEGGGGCGIPACTEADTPPVNRMTDRCKNITLATTSLRPVNMFVLTELIVRVRLYCPESENDIACRCIHRESNLMSKLSYSV